MFPWRFSALFHIVLFKTRFVTARIAAIFYAPSFPSPSLQWNAGVHNECWTQSHFCCKIAGWIYLLVCAKYKSTFELYLGTEILSQFSDTSLWTASEITYIYYTGEGHSGESFLNWCVQQGWLNIQYTAFVKMQMRHLKERFEGYKTPRITMALHGNLTKEKKLTSFECVSFRE